MSYPSFTVAGYASKTFSITFDILQAGCKTLSDMKTEDILRFQSKDSGTFDRVIFLESMFSDFVDHFGDDFKFDVHFLNCITESSQPDVKKVAFQCLSDHSRTTTGGYINFYFNDIKTLPDMIHRLEAFTKDIQENNENKAPYMKFMHLKPTQATIFGIPMETHEFKVKDGVVQELGIQSK